MGGLMLIAVIVIYCLIFAIGVLISIYIVQTGVRNGIDNSANMRNISEELSNMRKLLENKENN